MDKYVGKRLDGRYEIQEIIGVGGMAVVYKAHDNVENRTVAIKILKEEFVSNEEFLRRFKNESKAIAVLSHPNIVKVYDVSFGDLIQYIVMEYIDGITLKEFIERQGSLRWKDAVYLTIQILKGLQHAHDKGIVHRDIKPQNIMVLSDGSIKVADFGIARFARNEQRTITDKAIGSVHYISPEQARGEKTDEKSDIYSVGVMLYEMLTGQLPFEAESAVSVAIMQLQRDPKLPTEVNPSIPLGLEQITMHAMQKTPERRYQSASELLCDLEQFKKDPEATFDYSYFVDNAPTKYVDSIISSTPASAAVVLPSEEVEETKEKNNMIPILLGVASALVIAIIILAIIFVPKWFGNTGEEIPCPNFVGMTVEQAEKNEYFKSFDIDWEHIQNDKYDTGTICSQSQPEGKKLKSGAKIILYISKGAQNVKVPNDLYGQLEEYAVTKLKALGFETKVKYVNNDEVEEGHVIKTDPARTTVVAEGAEITIYVSSGKEVIMVDVPHVVGLKKEKAAELIEKAGLIPEFEERDLTAAEKDFKKGYVVAQDPNTETTEQVKEGSSIKVYISTGVVKYNYSLKAPIRDDFVDYKETGFVSIWDENGNQIAKSNEINFSKKKEHVFEEVLETTKTEIKYIAMVSFDGKNWLEYANITFDTEKNEIDNDKRIYDYQEYQPEEKPEPKYCDICGGELAGDEEHTDEDHITCQDCETVYHKDSPHECPNAE